MVSTGIGPCDYGPDHHFGCCPECGNDDGYLNIGREQWFLCHRCETCWCVGENLFDSWRWDTDGMRERSREIVTSYREVVPVSAPHLALDPRPYEDCTPVEFMAPVVDLFTRRRTTQRRHQ
jgi:hypothetical protein